MPAALEPDDTVGDELHGTIQRPHLMDFLSMLALYVHPGLPRDAALRIRIDTLLDVFAAGALGDDRPAPTK